MATVGGPERAWGEYPNVGMALPLPVPYAGLTALATAERTASAVAKMARKIPPSARKIPPKP